MYFNKESGENREGEKNPLTQQVIRCTIEVHQTLPIGLLINFNVKLLKDGIRRLFPSPSLPSVTSL
jgi:hypothetical protein